MYVSVMNWNESKTEHSKLALKRSNAVLVFNANQIVDTVELVYVFTVPISYRNPYGLIIGLG
jgi:hypothetical protein